MRDDVRRSAKAPGWLAIPHDDLTLAGRSVRVGYSAQFTSQVEHRRTAPSEAFVRACDVELGADGALGRLLPSMVPSG